MSNSRLIGAPMLCLMLFGCERAAPVCPPPPACPPAAAPSTAAEPTAVTPPTRTTSPVRAFALRVRGPASNLDKVRRCREQIRVEGGRLSEPSPIVATLTLDSTNRLSIRSAARGVVYDEALPPWTMWDLCRELSHRAMRAARSEPSPPSPSPPPSLDRAVAPSGPG